MNIRIKLYGVFRTAAKSSELYIAISARNPTVKSAISQLTSQDDMHGLKDLLLSGAASDPRPNALIMVSGCEVNTLKGLETELNEDDELALLPVAHGG